MSQQPSEALPGKGRVVRLALRKAGPDMNLAIAVLEAASNEEVRLEFENVLGLQFLGDGTDFDEVVALRSEAVPSVDGEPARLRITDPEFVTFTCTGFRREA